MKYYYYFTLIIRSDNVSYYVQCSVSCNKVELQSIKYSVHGQFLDLKTNYNFDLILSMLSLAFKLDKISLKNYSQSLTFLQVMLRLIY